MKVEYRIVDVEGDDVRYEFFEPWTEIPVKMRSVQFQNDHDPEGDGPTMIITLEYLHGDEGWSTFTEVKIDESLLRAALPIISYVSMGRGYVDVEPYPDAAARRVNAEIRTLLGEEPTG